MDEKETTENQPESKGIGSVLYEAFSAIKTTIVICLLLALVSLAGTLIRQNAPPEAYLQMYGPGMTKLFRALGLFDLYHSTGFFIILALLALNLILCSVKNLPGVWRLAYGTRRVPTLKALANREFNGKVRSPLSPEEVEARLPGALEPILGKAKRMEGKDGIAYFCRKGSFSRLGPYITHLSILLVLVGAMVGSVFGFRGYVNITEGQSQSAITLFGSGEKQPLGFEVYCEHFFVEFYETGAPKEFRSDLVIREAGQDVLHSPIRVNHPLTHRSITFYQASYGQDQRAEVELEIRVDGSEEVIPLKAFVQERTRIPGTKDDLFVMDFNPNLTMPARQPGTPRMNLGPGIQAMIFPAKKASDQEEQESHEGHDHSAQAHGRPFWVLEQHPDFSAGQPAPYKVAVKHIHPRYYTGLQVTKDPGTPLVWGGCILMIVGLVVAFYFSQKDLWALIQPGKKEGTVVTLGASVSKNSEGFEGTFKRITEAVEKALA